MTDQQDLMEKGEIGTHFETDEIKAIVIDGPHSLKSGEKGFHHGTDDPIISPAVKRKSLLSWRGWSKGKTTSSNEAEAEQRTQDGRRSSSTLDSPIFRNRKTPTDRKDLRSRID
tara:strand:- start:19 stop:360 length:342 start_codon:yes stop_codon:yes gene_type:complete